MKCFERERIFQNEERKRRQGKAKEDKLMFCLSVMVLLCVLGVFINHI
jgi:hypothetical protein